MDGMRVFLSVHDHENRRPWAGRRRGEEVIERRGGGGPISAGKTDRVDQQERKMDPNEMNK